MRMRVWALVLLVVAIVGAWLGAMMQMDPGYLLVAWRQTTIEMSLWVGLVLVIVLYISLYFALRVVFSLNAPWQFMARWSAEGKLRRAQLQTRQGLLALSNGQYSRAVEKLAGLVEETSQPLVEYLH